ncbi:hypothetical protein, partial [Paraglaciecola sp.]
VSQLRSHRSIELPQKKALVAAKAWVSLYLTLDKNRMIYMSYYPYKRLKQLQAASYIGGIAGMMAANAAKRGYYGFMTDDLLVDSVPETYPLKTDEISVGCDNHNEGEYFPSRVSGGHDVVVIWLKFEIDERPYHFRTLYEFQPFTEEAIQNGIGEAIESSISRIASKIEI